ncbi:MAG: transposase family protein [Methylomonas sp.]|nr:transposase family protein [Methylomonas sp.]
METESKLRLTDVFVSITDPRQAGKVEHDLVELLVVAVNAVLVGAREKDRILRCCRSCSVIGCRAQLLPSCVRRHPGCP